MHTDYKSVCTEPYHCVDPKATTLEEQLFPSDLVSGGIFDDHEDVTTYDVAGEDHWRR